VQQTPMTDEEIETGTWEEHEERNDALAVCDSLYFERPENIDDSLFAFIKANRSKIRPSQAVLSSVVPITGEKREFTVVINGITPGQD